MILIERFMVTLSLQKKILGKEALIGVVKLFSSAVNR